ncbi:MAG: (2Fe-2S)-binding protein [Thaumarchaeota archaeon]|nr:(2Fe-2S)-binding protein [Nitrososphaerota archaeon]
MSGYRISLQVNGRVVEVAAEPNEFLSDVLRDKLGLTGTKIACNEGVCGSCTVLLDGKPIYSCLKLACDVGDQEILTVEGLAQGEKLHPVQQAFLDVGSSQCGFCTTGFIMTTKALLDNIPDPKIDEVKQALSGNICRCTDYAGYVEAVLRAAQLARKATERA